MLGISGGGVNRRPSGAAAAIYENFDETPQAAPAHQISKQLAISRIEAMINQRLKRMQHLQNSSSTAANYKDYLLQNASAQLMHVKMTKEHDLAPQVAAYALFSTDIVGIDAAMDFIFERSGDSQTGKMQHVYLPYVPEECDDDDNQEAAMPYLDQRDNDVNRRDGAEELKDREDLELGGAASSLDDSFKNEFGSNEICFICQKKARDHDPRRRDSFYASDIQQD